MCLRSLEACVNCDGTLLSTCMKTGSLRSSMPVGQLLDLISFVSNIISTDTMPHAASLYISACHCTRGGREPEGAASESGERALRRATRPGTTPCFASAPKQNQPAADIRARPMQLGVTWHRLDVRLQTADPLTRTRIPNPHRWAVSWGGPGCHFEAAEQRGAP